MQVYNSYDEELSDVYSDEVANRSSMVFELFSESGNESMLFCGDLSGEEISNTVIQNFGSELSATYMQIGHHGNYSVNHAFIDQVGARTVFFDAPSWLVNGSHYDTSENIAYVRSTGAGVFTYAGTPHGVILE